MPWRALLAIAEADHRGRTFPDAQAPGYPDGERLAAVILTHHLDETPTKSLLSGTDLLTLGLTPGPEFGKLIRNIEAARDAGEILTKEAALERAKLALLDHNATGKPRT